MVKDALHIVTHKKSDSADFLGDVRGLYDKLAVLFPDGECPEGLDPFSDKAFQWRKYYLARMVLNDPDPAARMHAAFSLGEVITHHDFRPFEPDVRQGRKMRGHSGKNLKGYNDGRKSKAKTRRQVIAKLKSRSKLKGGALVAWLEDELVKRGMKVHRATIYRDLQK